jgi:hypothetical protein
MTLDNKTDAAAQRDACLTELNAFHEQIESSIQKENTDELDRLIESRAEVLTRLEALVRIAPLSKEEQTRLLDRERKLQTDFQDALDAFKKRLGDSRRRTGVITKYRKKGGARPR